jgi:hypothetical protein
MGVFDSMARGLEIGGALGRGQRQREQQDAQAGAFSTGGWQGAAKMAGSQGNFEAAQGFQQRATTEQNTGIARLRETLPVLARVGETLAPLPEAERGAAAQRFLPMLERMGIPPDQIPEDAWTDQGLAQLRALSGLSRFEDIKTLDDGSVIGIGRDGSRTEIQGPSMTAGAPTGHRFTDPSRTQLQRIPGWEPASGGAGGLATYSIMTPEEVQAAGLPPGSYQRNNANNQTTRIGATAGGFGPDQRARVAITLDPALEAAQTLERMEADAVQRQGTHGSNTPLGQDWGARMLEAVPWDGGTAARMAGGEDYNAYTSASSAFEAAMLPILSGAAVTESEAQRVVRAVLPRQGDTREVLLQKARRRRQMLNGAALIGGRELPYPEEQVADWAQRYANAAQQTQQDVAPTGGGSLDQLSDEELDALEQRLMGGQ